MDRGVETAPGHYLTAAQQATQSITDLTGRFLKRAKKKSMEAQCSKKFTLLFHDMM